MAVVKQRWRRALWLNRMRRTCWAELVYYAFGDDRDYYTLRHSLGRNDSCRRDAATSGQGVCYCGKVATQAALDAWGENGPRARVVLGQEAVRRIASGGDR